MSSRIFRVRRAMAALLLVASCGVAPRASGAEEKTQPKGADVMRFSVGGVQGILLEVGQFDMNVAGLFPEASAETLAEHGLDVETIVFTIRALYVESDGQRVVIEPGGIDAPDRLVSALRQAGIDPASVDVVIMTHAHLDHCTGGTTAGGEPSFPNARYYLQRTEWEHWLNPDNPEPQHVANFRRILLPIEDQITLLDGEGEIVPGIEGMLTPGHSPGHMTIHVGKALAYTGDALLHPLHVSHPEFAAAWDHWPEQVTKSRKAFLGRVANDGALVISTHFPAPGAGRVQTEGDGWRWVSETPAESP